MARIPNIKLVVGEGGKRDVTAYDADTGEAITNIFAISFNIDANADPIVHVDIKAGITVEYDGPADVEPLVVVKHNQDKSA